MGPEDTRGEVGQLPRHADEDDPFQVHPEGPPQRGPGEVADLDEADLGQAGQQGHGPFLCASAGAEHDSVLALGGHHRDRLFHACAPGRGGERPHDAGRAEDRDAAEYAQPGVGGLARHPLAAGHGNGDAHAARAEVRDLGHRLNDHRARGGGDRGLAHVDAETWFGDDADAVAGLEEHAGFRVPPHRRREVRAMGDVRVVAGVLDHDGCCLPGIVHTGRNGEPDPPAARERDLDGVLGRVIGQGSRGGLGGSRGAGARGPAGAQRAGTHLCCARQVRLTQFRLVRRVLRRDAADLRALSGHGPAPRMAAGGSGGSAPRVSTAPSVSLRA